VFGRTGKSLAETHSPKVAGIKGPDAPVTGRVATAELRFCRNPKKDVTKPFARG
jgi:hypothetical protein